MVVSGKIIFSIHVGRTSSETDQQGKANLPVRSPAPMVLSASHRMRPTNLDHRRRFGPSACWLRACSIGRLVFCLVGLLAGRSPARSVGLPVKQMSTRLPSLSNGSQMIFIAGPPTIGRSHFRFFFVAAVTFLETGQCGLTMQGDSSDYEICRRYRLRCPVVDFQENTKREY